MVYTSPSSAATLKTAERERSTTASPKWGRPVATFALALIGVWLLLYAAYVMLPFIRPGSDIIARAKFDTLVKRPMFGAQDRFRLMIFGHSKVLTSVRPRELDAAMGPGFRSYNLGLPGDDRFLPILEDALLAGNVPTHVLLTAPWGSKLDTDGVLDTLRNDAATANFLVPFRQLPRDATLFVFQNKNRMMDAIREVDAERSAMIDDRGWYFIKSQSHYADDRLPNDYALPTDRPTQIEQRKIPDTSISRPRLEQLARKYGFKVIMIPLPYRIGEYAPAPASDRTRLATISNEPPIYVLGPDYFSYPPALFSDPSHMNADGALVYTADLARLLRISGVFD